LLPTAADCSSCYQQQVILFMLQYFLPAWVVLLRRADEAQKGRNSISVTITVTITITINITFNTFKAAHVLMLAQ